MSRQRYGKPSNPISSSISFIAFVTDVTEMVLYVGNVVRIALRDGLVADGDERIG